MNTLIVGKEMLYCPTCKREYEDGSQRFCNNDGVRLLPVPEKGRIRTGEKKAVFTSLLGRAPAKFDRDESLGKSTYGKQSAGERGGFEPPQKSNVFRTKKTIEIDAPKPRQGESKKSKRPIDQPPVKNLPAAANQNRVQGHPEKKTTANPKPAAGKSSVPKVKPSTPTAPPSRDVREKPLEKPVSRLIDPHDIPSGRAELGDRKIKPTGRGAVSLSDPGALVGQVIKGRYRVIKPIANDRSSIAYTAEDNILKGKQVIVRVVVKGPSSGSFEDKIFLEERISLSHVNHPNVAKVIDSGELPEGKAFIVTAELRDNSVEILINKSADLNPLRVARIIRQASYALSEVHQNGILHRNLKPEHILLMVSEAGIEQIKVTDFCVSDGSVEPDNFRYKAPEQIGGQLPTFASDSFALAVIAYRLLTKRFPFEGKTEKEVLAAQKSGMIAKPSTLNLKLPAELDTIFEKALAYDPSKRFPKARDFGEILFGTLEKDSKIEDVVAERAGVTDAALPVPAREHSEQADPHLDGSHESAFYPEIEREPIEGSTDTAISNPDQTRDPGAREQSSQNETLWQNRSPEALTERGLLWTGLSLLGLVALILGVVGVWSYFFRNSPPVADPNEIAAEKSGNQMHGVDDKSAELLNLTESSIETPPPPRQVPAPPNSIYFENSKTNMGEKLAGQFRGFSLYYPESWKRKLVDKRGNKVDDMFLDIAISNKDGVPIEHFTVSPYESNGTFKLDTELFPALVEKSNRDISGSLKDATYKVIAQGATTIQNGRWKAYEVNFELGGEFDGEPFSIWGRRLWIPVQRPGVKTGFILTMLATSLSKDVKSADDVGKKGDLKKIVQTFEPVQDY